MKKVLATLLTMFLLATMIPLGAVSVSAHSVVMTATEFIDCLKTAMARPNVYPPEGYRKYPYNLGYYDGKTISWDCWNLGKSIIWSKGSIVNNYTVGTYAKVDTSCGLGDWDGLTIVRQAPNCSSDFSNLVPGEWLYLDGHTGYYIGDGQVIECTLSWNANGVTVSQIDSNGNRSKNGVPGSKWLYHGMVPWLDYSTVTPDPSNPNLISEKYNSHCNIKITSDNAYVKSMPCSKDTDPDSVDVEKAQKGDVYEAKMLCKNKWGLLWYQVKAKNGKTGYVYAGDTKFIDQRLDDVGVDDPVSPTNIKKGNPFNIGGHIYSTHQAITRVQAWVTNTDDTVDYLYGHADNLVTASYDLGGSAVDNMLKFDSLGVGTYRYVVRVRVDSYYAADSKTVAATYYDELYLDECESVFTVTNSSCSHSYDVTVKNPSCTEGGYSTYVCKYCGAQYDSDYVEATGHYYETVVTKPTCTRQGFTEHCCQWCEDYYKDSYVDPLGHSYKGWITAEATCGADGVMTYTCSSCGDSYNEAIPAIGNHTYDNACDTTCNICGEEREVADHDYVLESFTDATCDFYGIAVYVCSKCGIYYSETIPATGNHTYDDEYDADCNVCGALREVPEKPPVTPDLPADAPAFVVEDASVCAGQEFTVAIRTERNSGIVSFKLKLDYDADLLELVSVVEKDFTNMSFSPLTNNPFIINWVDALRPNNTTNGVVALVTFRVKEGAAAGKTEINLSYVAEDVYDQNFDNVAFLVENGAVEIVDYTPGDVNDDGAVNNKDLGLLQRLLNEWDVTANEKAADANGDGAVNNKDLGILQRYLNEWDVELG